jgi:hypothetical protein
VGNGQLPGENSHSTNSHDPEPEWRATRLVAAQANLRDECHLVLNATSRPCILPRFQTFGVLLREESGSCWGHRFNSVGGCLIESPLNWLDFSGPGADSLWEFGEIGRNSGIDICPHW